MHILLVNNIYPPIMAGGAELIVAWLSQGLATRGCRVTVVSTCAPEMEPYPTEISNGVAVIRFFPRNLYWSFARAGEKPHHRILWHLRDAWNLDAGRRFRAILADAPPHIVHTHLIDGFSATIWRRARQARVPVVHTAHDYHLLCPRAFLLTRDWRICRDPAIGCRLYRAWHLRTARDVDLFVSPSNFLLDRHRASGLAARQTAVVRNGIPLPRSVTPRREQTGRPRFLFLTRLTVEKGARVVLKAIASLPKTLDFELVIAGRGPLEREMREAVRGDARIRYLGYVTGEVKEALLTDSHYLLLPSLWYENAPVAVIEAAAYGLGVIGSRIGGVPELVRDDRTGVLFEPGDAAALARIIGELVRGERRLIDFHAHAQALLDEHSVDRMVDAYLGHYQRLLAPRASALTAQPHAAETDHAD
jgi:glycosyltransferase involved in cell wall biosynthesis